MKFAATSSRVPVLYFFSMLEDLKKNQMHSVTYRIILLFLIIPFVLCCMWLIFGIFVLHWKKTNVQLIQTFRIAFILGFPALIAHSICALIAAPHVNGYEPPEPVYKDPLIEYFPGPQHYVIGQEDKKSKFRRR